MMDLAWFCLTGEAILAFALIFAHRKPASVPSLDEIIQNFDEIEDNCERFEYLLELGHDVEDLPEGDKRSEFLVQGCQSQVWVIPAESLDSAGKLAFRADSDSLIVRGIVALLLACYSGKTPAEILAFEIKPLLLKLGLARHLSPSRSNGLFSMVRRIEQIAGQYAAITNPPA